MAFQSSVTDEEVKDYLHENVGDFRPDWQSLYFDLVGVGELGGLAQISKRAATRMLAGDFRQALKQFGNRPTEAEANVFRNIIKGVRRAPQEVLDPLSEIRLARNISDKYGRKYFGRYGPRRKEIGLGLKSLTKRAEEGDLTKAANTLYHEISHSMQDEAGHLASQSRDFMEAHANVFAQRVEEAYKAGKPLSMDFLKGIYDEGLSDITDLVRKGDTYKGIKTRIQQDRRLGSLVDELGGESFFSGEYKVGDLIDVPGVGKVRYDAAMEPFEGKGLLHQYTIQEGPAKGATIGSYKEGLDELIKIASEKTKQFAEGMKFKLEDFDF